MRPCFLKNQILSSVSLNPLVFSSLKCVCLFERSQTVCSAEKKWHYGWVYSNAWCCVYCVTGVATITVKGCASFSLRTGVIFVKGSTDTISNSTAGNYTVQPRQPWDMIPLLGSFMSDTHGRVEAQGRDATLFLASRRSICGGLCGEPGKASWLVLRCLCQPISSIPTGWSPLIPYAPVHILCTLSIHTLAATKRPWDLPQLSCWRCGHRKTAVWSQLWSTGQQMWQWDLLTLPLLLLVWWLKKTSIFEWTRETFGGPLSW